MFCLCLKKLKTEPNKWLAPGEADMEATEILWLALALNLKGFRQPRSAAQGAAGTTTGLGGIASFTPALAQLDCARRGQVCPADGQTGYRGAPDPLYAHGAYFNVGIFQEPVCSLPPFAHPGMPPADRVLCCADFAERA